MTLQIRLLSLAEAEKVYKNHVKYDFPRNELRPFAMIKKYVDLGNYHVYGIFEADELRAYACLLEETESGILLADYFAVCREWRGQGYGTKAMELLSAACQGSAGLILEVEDPESTQDEAEVHIRCRRIAFYERCGMKLSSVRIYLFGVEYCMMYKTFTDEMVPVKIADTMECLYGSMLPNAIFKKMFHVLSK
ncbi:MAG: GNAT family N-acetyltransferase [Lachnospiraceae bacterium]|nr:GNAT family N-acetyltransferase [Lachnospiraceae bacterium]